VVNRKCRISGLLISCLSNASTFILCHRLFSWEQPAEDGRQHEFTCSSPVKYSIFLNLFLALLVSWFFNRFPDSFSTLSFPFQNLPAPDSSSINTVGIAFESTFYKPLTGFYIQGLFPPLSTVHVLTPRSRCMSSQPSTWIWGAFDLVTAPSPWSFPVTFS